MGELVQLPTPSGVVRMTDARFAELQAANPALNLGRYETTLGTVVFRSLRRIEDKRRKDLAAGGKVADAIEFTVLTTVVEPTLEVMRDDWLEKQPSMVDRLCNAVLEHSGLRAQEDLPK